MSCPVNPPPDTADADTPDAVPARVERVEGAHVLHPVPGSRWGAFRTGLGAPWRGFRFLLAHSELWGWAALPLFLTLWLIVGAGMSALWLTDDVLAWIVPPPDPADHSARAVAWMLTWDLLWLVAAAGVFLASAAVFWVAGHVLAGPFYDKMAEGVEQWFLGAKAETFDWKRVLGDAAWSLLHSLMGLTLYAAVMVPLFALNLVPVAGSVLYTVLATVASSFFLARDLLDVPLSRRRLAFTAKLAYVRANAPVMFGLGLATVVLLAVPFANLVVLPCAVVGGTLIYLRIEHGEPVSPEEGPRR